MQTRRTIFKSGIVWWIVLLPTCVQAQQWQFMNGPYGGEIRRFAIASSDTLYAAILGGEGGVYKTTTAGSRWTRVGPDTLFIPGVHTVAVSPRCTDSVYYGGSGALFISSNGGQQWNPAAFLGRHVFEISIDRVNPSVMYAGLRAYATDDVICKSTDGGRNWVAKTNGIPFRDSTQGWQDGLAIEINPLNRNAIFASVVLDGVYRTDNAGESWRFLGLRDLFVDAIRVLPWDTSLVFAGANPRGLFKSTDGGGN